MEFFQTIMGRQFYDGTMPRIADALTTIAKVMEAESALAAPPRPAGHSLQGENDRLRDLLRRAETELHDRHTLCDGSCDIALARRQVGPDGVVPGNAKQCAELWEAEARRVSALNREAAEHRKGLVALLREAYLSIPMRKDLDELNTRLKDALLCEGADV